MIQKPCAWKGCKNLTSNSRYCEQHKPKENKKRNISKEYNKWYSCTKWKNARKNYLSENPLCVECLRDGTLTPATIVDHIEPHKGNNELFWNRNNWQPLCKKCHDWKTNKFDGGFGNRIIPQN